MAEDGRDLALHHGMHDGGTWRVCGGREGTEDDAQLRSGLLNVLRAHVSSHWQYLRHEDGDDLGGGGPDPLRDVLEVEAYHHGVVRNSEKPVEHDWREVRCDWRTSRERRVGGRDSMVPEPQRQDGARDHGKPGPAVILKARIIETGEYKAICEEIRTIKETATSAMGGKAANGRERERVYIIALAPACLMTDKNRKSLEEILTKRKGGGTAEKRAIKEIRDDMKKFGVELGDDHPNVMVAWVGPGQAGDTRDDNVKERSMSDEGESVFRRMMSTMGVIPHVLECNESADADGFRLAQFGNNLRR